MNSITIITLVVIALLTAAVFGLAWLGYSSCIKAYRFETEAGKHDDEILKEYHFKKKKSGLVGIICSYLALTALFGLFVTGAVYKAKGENFSVNNQTVLVIKTGSMSDYYDDELARKHPEYKDLQFDVGDICFFESLPEDADLHEGEVYGYKYKNIIITHRWVLNKDTQTYHFKGDNNYNYDGPVARKNVIYHYTGHKILGLGAFILYAQSIFGIWSIIGLISIAISSEIVYYKINKINKERDKLIYQYKDKKLLEEKPQQLESAKKIKARFKRRNGVAVIIYEKDTQKKSEINNEK